MSRGSQVAQSQRSPSKVSLALQPRVSPRRRSHTVKTFAATTMPDLFSFLKTPLYSLIYSDPYTFQQLQLHFRIRLSSPEFKPKRSEGGGYGKASDT